MRIRIDKTANYRAVFFNGKTIRQRIDITKPITTPKYPEIEDVAINDKCYANCPYCYTSATKNGKNFELILNKVLQTWGKLNESDRPTQIAIGGAGEATIHPQFTEFVELVRSLNIVPNYTTNGMHLSDEVLEATEKYCGGVAVSYHPHIKPTFHKAIEKLSNINTRLNTHLIIGSKESLIDAQVIYEMYKDKIEYFVMLPYQAVGRAEQIEVDSNWKLMFDWISSLEPNRQKQFAFGALFYEWMLNNDIPLKIDIYEPEIYSGYRIFDESYKTLRKSSYNLEEK